ncbi:MAG: F0F1 ATP synthase subunit epsilon [Peptococcaceae bacterium]|nr:F0F1 ATP synthase subunit epsilon [Peptococcaceae bacterium]
MAGTFFFQVVSPVGAVLTEDVQFVVLPGTEGELGILPNHTPLMSSVACGVVRYTLHDEVKKMAVSGGFVEVSHNQVTLLAETAELAEHIDCFRAEDAKARAEERLKVAMSMKDANDIDLIRAEAALKRAISRIGASDQGNKFS